MFVFCLFSIFCVLCCSLSSARQITHAPPVAFRLRDLGRKGQSGPSVSYEELFFEQTLDHFNFATKHEKYRERYLISYDYWQGEGEQYITFYFLSLI
jgi:hypothetical protein